ncbi:hypothetical protein BDF20DRAFT_855594, partial [Mycotypha africana]|uniref:uncharacterized protein n=1 Tax=Mycotypha africana TaxID=64632 RepID=UPI002301E3D9
MHNEHPYIEDILTFLHFCQLMLFSFALFTLPTQNSKSNYLTVGGSDYFAATGKSQYPTIGSSSFNNPDKLLDDGLNGFYSNYYHPAAHDQHASTDLVLLDSVRPNELQMWINDKLNAYPQQKETAVVKASKKNIFARWLPKFFFRSESVVDNEAIDDSTTTTTSGPNNEVYLYSNELTKLAYVHHSQQQQQHQYQQDQQADRPSMSSPPRMSIFSPYNRTTADQSDTFLKIDVQILNSAIVKGQLLPMHPFGNAALSSRQALLDTDAFGASTTTRKRKNDVNSSFNDTHSNNHSKRGLTNPMVSNSASTLARRDIKRAKKLSRVI